MLIMATPTYHHGYMKKEKGQMPSSYIGLSVIMMDEYDIMKRIIANNYYKKNDDN